MNSSWRSAKAGKSPISTLLPKKIPFVDKENDTRMGSWSWRELEEEDDGHETTLVSSGELFLHFQ